MQRILITLVTLVFLFSCQKEISLEAGKPSSGALQDNGGDCLPKLIGGTFEANKTLNDSNYLDVTVAVSLAGTYRIYSDTVNGYYFSGAGSFAVPGTNTIRLRGIGKPLTEGNDLFTIYYDSSFCSIQVPVVPAGTLPATGDHFILTDNSWWSYTTPVPGDTLKRTISGSVNANGVTYKVLKEKNTTNVYDDSLYVRKSGNNYYELNYSDYYSSFYFDTPVLDSLLFLKEGLVTGDAWTSSEYTGTVGGVDTKLKYLFSVINANATVTYNGRTYTNVYQVSMKSQKSENGGAYADDVTWINYYAPGVGWIYQKYDDGTQAFELPIRYFQVF
jgi:hypothetical protein